MFEPEIRRILKTNSSFQEFDQSFCRPGRRACQVQDTTFIDLNDNICDNDEDDDDEEDGDFLNLANI